MNQITNFLKDFKKSPFKAYKKLKANENNLSNSFLEEAYTKLGDRLIFEYFKQDIVIDVITSFLINKNYKYSLISIKKHKSFLKPKHFESLKKDIIDNDVLKIFTFWNQLNESILEKVEFYDSYIRKINLETLLVRLAIIYEYDRLKNPTLYVDNPDKVAIIEKIIHRKSILENLGSPSNSSEYLFELFKKELSIMIENPIEFDILKSLYNVYDLLDNFQYLLDEYSLNGAGIKLIDNTTVKLNHPSEFKNSWQINNSKNTEREHYFNNITQILSKKSENEEVSKHLLKYSLHNLENDIIYNSVSFTASLYVDLFEHIDYEFNNAWNLIADSVSVLTPTLHDNDILNVINVSSKDRTPIDSLDYSHETNQEKVKKEQAILDWSSNDFNYPEKIKNIDLSLNPFIKYGTQHIAFSGIISNKNIGDILATKVRLLFKNKKEYGTNLENKITQLFNQNKFNTYSGAFQKGKGEFDLLAYKDACLFIIETKASKGRLSIQDIENHRRDTLTKVISQLDKNYIEIKEDFENLKTKLDIQEDFEDLVLVPIAITNNFEFEEEEYKSENYHENIRKISAFELELILNDTVCILYDNPSNLLWRKLHEECPSKILYNSIKQRTVWSLLIENIKSEDAISQTHSFGEFKVIF